MRERDEATSRRSSRRGAPFGAAARGAGAALPSSASSVWMWSATGCRSRRTCKARSMRRSSLRSCRVANVEATPVMVVTPELDAMSPPEEQRELFDRFKQRKQFYLAAGKGHLTVLSGEGFEDAIGAQLTFIGDVLGSDSLQ